ncbi:family 16 glycoside hydrolase [Paraprevotella clara]|uniref:family 16 glycoside hydrolase n=1 Tax=Paraprevotella clara TaxID=454154 RepID=UPI003AB44897
MKYKHLLLTTTLAGLIGTNALGQKIDLLNSNLTHWYKWIGVPHHSVEGLPEYTPLGDGMEGTPLGLNDPKNVFSVVDIDGEDVLKVTGEIYGGLTTKENFSNYHLHLKYKWGEKKWEPRLDKSRDMGIMFHLTGTNEDAFWSVFMTGIEFQISKGTTGDLFLIGNKDGSITTFADARIDDRHHWNPKACWTALGKGRGKSWAGRLCNNESPQGEWTDVDLYTVGSEAVYLVNGKVVMAMRNIGKVNADKSIETLVSGKIQLQSEGAEGYYKDITIEHIEDFPNDIKTQAALDFPTAWKLGVATFSFNNEPFVKRLENAASTGIGYIEGYSFGTTGPELGDSIIYNLSSDGLRNLKSLIDRKNLKMTSLYINGGKSCEGWVKEFKVAKELGVEYVTCEPREYLWNAVDSLAKLHDLKVAFHNHGNGKAILKAIERHPSFMACPDIGHWVKSGIDPVVGLKELEGHILAIHLKDINESKSTDCPMGKGIINFPAVFKELKRQNFDGYIIIELDASDNGSNLPSVRETIRYYNSILDIYPD